MKETMEINVHFQTTREQLSKLEERIIDFIAQNTRDYESGTMMKVLRLNNRESMHIAFTVHHRSNFQSGENRNSRNIKFWETLRAAIAELHIKLAPAH
jgi:transcription elongation factor